eukprot:TRINITY_DN27622_c0_g1_i1.p1 TRINITY_DN27622_c0_g1~~TRINITY_DN27622_c0_g1_i1.p1  ORF type:complete len:311 (+),score=47.00 TRINITY_DN27622_c0_g1_i1:48-980(+)
MADYARLEEKGDARSDLGQEVFGMKKLNWIGCVLVVFPGCVLLVIRLVILVVLCAIFMPLTLVVARCCRRSVVAALMKFNSRTLLFMFGFLWIRRTGKKHKVPEDGCVIVSNHIGIAEIMWFTYEYGAAFVAKAAYRGLPVAGEVGEHMDYIYVDQTKGSGASDAVLRFFAEGRSDRRRLCIFPEGTTTNGKYVAEFRSGAFLPPVGVLPHALRLTFCEGYQFDPHYTVGKVHWHVLRLMCNVWNCLHVEYLPTADFVSSLEPRERAERVRKTIAEALDVSLAEASWPDKLEYETRLGYLKPKAAKPKNA